MLFKLDVDVFILIVDILNMALLAFAAVENKSFMNFEQLAQRVTCHIRLSQHRIRLKYSLSRTSSYSNYTGTLENRM